jgi:hypothetical protein
MPLLWVSLVVLLETRSAGAGAADTRLATAALASPRPRECRATADGSDGLWARARAGDAERYCELLARGYARLQQTPADALAAAEAAEALAGDVAPVHVLNGRAKLRLGQALDALAQFMKAESEDAQAFLDPKALHDYARAASLAGKPLDAVRLYRMLVSRSALLDDVREKSIAQIEAAAHVLAYVPGGSDEALGYLAQARRDALGLSPWITGLRILTAERNGRVEHTPATGSPPSLASLTQSLSGASGEAPLLPIGELEALCAALTESTDPNASRNHVEQFLAHAKGENVWLGAAQKKHAELASGKGKAR